MSRLLVAIVVVVLISPIAAHAQAGAATSVETAALTMSMITR